MIWLIIVLIVIGVCLQLFKTHIDPTILKVVYVLILLMVVCTILSMFGLLPANVRLR